MKPVGLMGATALASLAGFALTCGCSHLSSLGSDLCVSCSICLLFSVHVPLFNNYELVPCFFALFCFYEGLQPIFGSSVSSFDLPPRQLGVMTKPTANCSIEPRSSSGAAKIRA